MFADDIILYIENPKDTIRKFPVLISEFSKVTGYKINTQKSFAFLYTNNEKSEREIKESIPFTITTKGIKYLGINLTKKTLNGHDFDQAPGVGDGQGSLLCYSSCCHKESETTE